MLCKQEKIKAEKYNVLICDLLSKNLALPAIIEFELDVILSIQVVFQLNSDYYTNVLEGASNVSYQDFEAQPCNPKDAISLSSQAGQ